MTSETEFELVQRHACASAKAIERQQDIIFRLSALGVSPHLADATLRTFVKAILYLPYRDARCIFGP